jgi:hypothetical protein
MYATDLQYATGSEKARLALRGYKATGEQNTFGKIMSWTPALGLAQNAMARNYAEKIGATDAWENIKEDTDNRLKKQGVIAGAALMAAGGIAAAPALGGILGGGGAAAAGASAAGGGALSAGTQLFKTGLGMTSNFAGMLAFDQDEDSEDSNYIYR